MSEQNQKPNSDQNLILKDEQALLLDHDYDGIQELDHPLPGWWLAVFYITIVFAVGYVVYYMTGWGPTLTDELNTQMAAIEASKPKAPEGGNGLTDEALAAMAKDPSKIEAGKVVFTGKCAPCHGDVGQGIIGPNLTDDNWIHGKGAPTDIMKVVTDGVADKGMPPWGPVLTPDELTAVVVYIRSIHGSNPPNPKEPQGDHYDFQTL